MRVTWMIVTIGLMWTGQAQSDNPNVPTTAKPSSPDATVATNVPRPAPTAGPTAIVPVASTTAAPPTAAPVPVVTTSAAPTPAATTAGAKTEKPTPPPAVPSATVPKVVSGAPDTGRVEPATTKTSDTGAVPPGPTDKPPTSPPVTDPKPSPGSADVGKKGTAGTPTPAVPTTASSFKDKTPTPAPTAKAAVSTATGKPSGTTAGAGAGSADKSGPAPSTARPGSVAVSPSIKSTDKTPERATSGPVQTTAQPTTATTPVAPTTTVKMTTVPTTTAAPIPFSYVYNKNAENETVLTKVCAKLLEMITGGNCSINGKMLHDGTHVFDTVSICGNVNISVVDSHYKEFQKEKEKEREKESKTAEESDPTTLIAILASCGAVALIIVGLAFYTYCHGKNYRKNQQHLTEELQTVENGYHDNPTLEVMEVQQETSMEKRPNGDFNDCFIVPMDNLHKEEPDEQDTHL